MTKAVSNREIYPIRAVLLLLLNFASHDVICLPPKIIRVKQYRYQTIPLYTHSLPLIFFDEIFD